MKQALPRLSRVAVLVNPANASHALRVREAQAVAATLKVQIEVQEVSRADQLEAALSAITSKQADAILVASDSLFTWEGDRLAALAGKRRLPAMYGLREHVTAGGLMAYGASFTDLYRRAATYVDKILKGAKPADLPVEQPTKFEFVINLKTAKAFGLTIPPSVLARADELIQ
jgi:putative ABC transport system substrate-binding protein